MPAAATSSASPDNGAHLKRRRITRACDRCHRSGVKCGTSNDPTVCGPCAAFGSECTYNRPVKRRGPAPRSANPNANANANSNTNANANASVTFAKDVKPAPPPSKAPSGDAVWVYESVAPPDVIEHLVDAYHRIVYPMLPYFHWPTFSAHVRTQRYMRDRAFFTVVMAVCAISGARLRDGAGMEALGVTPARRAPDSESFYSAANRAFPADLSQATEFDYKRAKVLLAMLWIQYGHPPRVAANLGDYMTMCSIDSFHSEARWPPGLTVAEVQERRRLFWGAYTVDIYTATTWNFPVRHRELQCTVVYPAAVDDEDITDMGIVSGRLSWMEGWLFTNDLYRVLEHTLDQLRQRRLPIDTSRVTALWHDRSRPSAEEVLAVVDKLYERLSPEFKQAKSVTGDIRLDRFGFQAADIIATMQTLKMVILALQDSTIEQRCAVASEMLEALSTVPTAYIQAISTPILHHLAGVGHLLGGVIQSPLSHSSYDQVRYVLLRMADLLYSLESTLSFVHGIADRLRDHVSRIDDYMRTAAREQEQAHQQQQQVHPPPRPHSGPTFSAAPPVSAWRHTADKPRVRDAHTTSPHASTLSGGSEAMWPVESATRSSEVRSEVPPTPSPFAPPSAPLPVEYAPQRDLVSDMLKINQQQVQLPHDLFLQWPIDFGESFPFFNFFNEQY